jgi:hypothetical protein
MRLEMEGVRFRGARVDMKSHGLYTATSRGKALRRNT